MDQGPLALASLESLMQGLKDGEESRRETSDMPYRESWVLEILGDRSVVEVALDVHMTVTGSMERCRAVNDADARALKRVVDTWHPSQCEFDGAVLALIQAALREHDRLVALLEWDDREPIAEGDYRYYNRKD